MKEVSFVCIPYSFQLATRSGTARPDSKIGHAFAKLITFCFPPNELELYIMVDQAPNCNVFQSCKNARIFFSNTFTSFPKPYFIKNFKNFSESDTHLISTATLYNSINIERVYLQ